MLNSRSLTLYLTTTLICGTAVTYADATWKGGKSENSLMNPWNWSSTLIEDVVTFNTTQNPPYLNRVLDLHTFHVMEFKVPGVVITLNDAALSIGHKAEGGAVNSSAGLATFQLFNKSEMSVDGGSLAEKGQLRYLLDQSSLMIRPAGEGQIEDGQAEVILRNGSRFKVMAPSKVESLSSDSAQDRIVLEQDPELTFSGNPPLVLTIGNKFDQVIEGQFEGSGNLLKVGSGSLTLNNDHPDFKGSITVQNGTLVVNGKVDSVVEITSGASLKGTGSIRTAYFNNKASLILKDTSSSIQIERLEMSPDTTTQITIDPTTSPQIYIGDRAHINGRLIVEHQHGHYPTINSYKIVGGPHVEGNFIGEIEGGLPGYEYTTEKNSNPNEDSFLVTYKKIPLNTQTLQKHEMLLANHLFEHQTHSLDYGKIFQLSSQELTQTLSSLLPTCNIAGTIALQNTFFSINRVLNSHLSHSRALQASDKFAKPMSVNLYNATQLTPIFANNSNAVWVEGFGQMSHQKAEKNISSFKYDSTGILVGGDREVNNRIFIGAALGYVHTRLTQHDLNAKATLHSLSSAVYSTYHTSNFYIDAGLTGGYNSRDIDRAVTVSNLANNAKSTVPGWHLAPHMGVGYDFNTKWGNIGPYVNAGLALNWEDSYSEKGAEFYNAHFDTTFSSMIRTDVGMQASQSLAYQWGVITLQEKAGYIYKKSHENSINVRFQGINEKFPVDFYNHPHHLISFNIDLTVQYAGNSPDIKIAYAGEYGKTSLTHGLILKLSKNF